MPTGQCFLSNQDLSLSLKGPPIFGQISHLLLINYLALPSDTKAPKVRGPLYVCHHPNNHPPLSLQRSTHRSTENSEYFMFAPSLSIDVIYESPQPTPSATYHFLCATIGGSGKWPHHQSMAQKPHFKRAAGSVISPPSRHR